MIISILAALDEAGGIGKNNRLPWHLPADLKNFKQLTFGHHLILGRQTYESIGRPLPGRIMIIISRINFRVPKCLVAASLAEALSIAQQAGEDEVFVIGGGQVFALALPVADRLYLTRVHAVFEADTYFPSIKPMDWCQVQSVPHPVDENNPYPFTFQVFVRAAS